MKTHKSPSLRHSNSSSIHSVSNSAGDPARVSRKILSPKAQLSHSPEEGGAVPLTEKERAVLAHIESCLMMKGLAPSYQEICSHFGWSSLNSVQNYVKQLIRKGYIERASHQKRALQLKRSPRAVQQFAQSLSSQAEVNASTEVPLLGRVAAGSPLEAITHEESISVPSSMLPRERSVFALRVSGQSMIEEGILDGDILLVQKQATAQNGDIVVASIEQEATVKRFYFQKKAPASESLSASPMVELRPANSTMKSLWYLPEQVRIQGLVIGLIRHYQRVGKKPGVNP